MPGCFSTENTRRKQRHVNIFLLCNSLDTGILLLLAALRNRAELAELHVVGPGGMDMKFALIKLTDEIRELNDRIIDCYYVDNQWVFKKLRNDRQHPNGKIAVTSISKLFTVGLFQSFDKL